MSVHDKLESLKAQRTELKRCILNERSNYEIARNAVRQKEDELKRAKTYQNRMYKQWTQARQDLAAVERKIKALPSQIRQYVKKKPFEALERAE